MTELYRFPRPEPLDGECAGCDWESNVMEHDHGDFERNFRTFEEWEAHPSKSLAQAMSSMASARAGCSDWDSECATQAEAEEFIEAMQQDGWRFVRAHTDSPNQPTDRPIGPPCPVQL